MTSSTTPLTERLAKLGLHGLAAELEDLISRGMTGRWGPVELLEEAARLEEASRTNRSLKRRLEQSQLGSFVPMADFDYSWPTSIDRPLVERCLRLGFVADGGNVIVVGPHGVGKTTLVKNIGYAAILGGHRVQFVTASKLVGHLLGTDSPSTLKRRLSEVVNVAILLIDELGYLSYSDRAADLLFEIVSRRHEARRPIVLSTNLAFRDWGQVFPNATCTVALVDRLTHRADIIKIEAQSWRRKEAAERAERLRQMDGDPLADP